jgi:hypothetical protein
MRYATTAAAALLALGLLAACSEKPTQGSATQPVDFATIAKPWPFNSYLVCPLDLCPEPSDATSPSFTLPVAQLESLADKAILAQPGVTAAGGDPGRHQRIYQGGTTAGGPIWVQFFALSPTRSTLALYTGSNLPYYDMNASRELAEDWLRAIRQAAGADAVAIEN